MYIVYLFILNVNAPRSRFRLQVHDWNQKKSEKDKAYQEEYHRRMSQGGGSGGAPRRGRRRM